MFKDPPVSFLRYNYRSSTVFYVSAGEAHSSPNAFVENFCPLSNNEETVPNVINSAWNAYLFYSVLSSYPGFIKWQL